MIERILRLLFGCQHEHFSFPQSGRQKCLECGAWRTYRDYGDTPGPWCDPRPDRVYQEGVRHG